MIYNICGPNGASLQTRGGNREIGFLIVASESGEAIPIKMVSLIGEANLTKKNSRLSFP